MVASNPAVSGQTGWPIGFWWAELTHPYWEFTVHGYQADIASPDGGPLQADSWSDPRDESGYSAEDLSAGRARCRPSTTTPEYMTSPPAVTSMDDDDRSA